MRLNIRAVICCELMDGWIIHETGNTNLLMESAGAQFLVIQHRNHLAVASPATVLTNRTFAFDFTNGAAQYFGGTNAAVELAPGVWTMRPVMPMGTLFYVINYKLFQAAWNDGPKGPVVMLVSPISPHRPAYLIKLWPLSGYSFSPTLTKFSQVFHTGPFS
jgi:hypothetical protein